MEDGGRVDPEHCSNKNKEMLWRTTGKGAVETRVWTRGLITYRARLGTSRERLP